MAAIISCVSTMVTFSLLFLILIPSASCWDNDDLELFDLVEEINQNFYELFGIEQTATTSEVRKAYRRLSLRLHPDKNDAEDAEEKFRQIVAVYEVLKDETKRGKYNQVLIDGLPDWRQPVYYYRRARKMGLTELAIVLFIISIIGQYCVGWAVYIEKRLVVEDMMSSKRKKKGKKGKSGGEEEEETFTIPTPTVLGLWPFRFSVFFVKSVYNLPTTVKEWKEEKQWRKEEEERQKILEEKLKQEQLQFEEELQLQRKAKKRVQPELPEYTSEMYAKFSATTDGQKSDQDQGLVSELERAALAQERIGEEWTDEELVLLAKAVKKFPGGTMERWERIAEMVGRTVTEVTNKSKESKGGFAIKPNTSSVQGSANAKSNVKISDAIMTQSTDPAVEEEDVDGLMDDNVKVRKRKGHAKTNGKAADRTLLISQDKEKKSTIVDPVQSKSSKSAESSSNATSSNATAPVSLEGTKLAPDGWTQNQQTIFEWALKQHPKGSDKRWDLISEHIPGKSKEDCIARFKELAELISKKKKVDLLSKSKSS